MFACAVGYVVSFDLLDRAGVIGIDPYTEPAIVNRRANASGDRGRAPVEPYDRESTTGYTEKQ